MSPTVNRDAEHLGKLQDYYARWRGLPSYARLCAVLGMASRTAVMKTLNRLREAGYLTKTPDDVWVPGRRFFERDFFHFRVPAGSPVTAAEAPGDAFLLDEFLVDAPSRTSFVPVKGDSMIGAGIHDGDLAVVERAREAARGDIVVALVDGEVTIKRLDVEEGGHVLRPENPAYPVIRPQGELNILGVVTGLARKLKR